MKLRNKKTGEIAPASNIAVGIGKDGKWYDSLAELNAEWEDYEEPKEWWYLDVDGEICSSNDEDDMTKDMKYIGNYFESKEEAEKAVEKLKAWKLLKDECDIKFNGIIRDNKAMLKGVNLSYDRHTVIFNRMQECLKALHLLFGGEE